MSTKRACKHSNNSFCYVCGLYIAPKQVSHRIEMKTKFSEAYFSYFGISIGNQDKPWAPHVTCGSCRSVLEAWYRSMNRKMPFEFPMVWREPKDHVTDCYFCVVNVSCYKKPQDRKKIIYPELESISAPIFLSKTILLRFHRVWH